VTGSTVTVVLPTHLRTLAGIDGDVTVEVPAAPTIGDVLDALETANPVLRGTIREHGTGRRRAFVRFFACEQDLSHEPHDTPVPSPVVNGTELFRIVGAIAGG
jgi:sulfur-carrier protein